MKLIGGIKSEPKSNQLGISCFKGNSLSYYIYKIHMEQDYKLIA